MKKPSVRRRERRSEPISQAASSLATLDFLRAHELQERKAGRLFNQNDLLEILNAETRQAIQIVYMAIMESHTAGARRIMRDIDPLVVEIYKGLDRMTKTDGAEYAITKLSERYEKAKRETYRKEATKR